MNISLFFFYTNKKLLTGKNIKRERITRPKKTEKRTNKQKKLGKVKTNRNKTLYYPPKKE